MTGDLADAVRSHDHHASILRSHQWRTAENSAGYLLPYLPADAEILDIGCGPGTITADLAALVVPGGGRVMATDFAADALGTARAEAAGRGVEEMMFVVADAHALAFPDQSFDVVHAHQVLQHVTDPVRALREMRRVCRPGGVVAARDCDHATYTWYPEVPELAEWLALYRGIARENGGQPDAGRRLRAWARAAGFADEVIIATSGTWCFATPREREWWGTAWAEQVCDSEFARQAVDRGYATRADLARMSDAWRAWAGDPDGWFSAVHGEILCRV